MLPVYPSIIAVSFRIGSIIIGIQTIEQGIHFLRAIRSPDGKEIVSRTAQALRTFLAHEETGLAQIVIDGILGKVFGIVVAHGHGKGNTRRLHHFHHLAPTFHGRLAGHNIARENHHIRLFGFQYLQKGFRIPLFALFRTGCPVYISQLGNPQLAFLETERHGYRLGIVRQNQVVNQCPSVGSSGKVYQDDAARLRQVLSLLHQHGIHHFRESGRTCYRQSRSTGKADVPPVVLTGILHGGLHVFPSNLSLIGCLTPVLVAIFIFHRHEGFISFLILECHPASGIVVPSVALGTGIFLQDAVAMHEHHLSTAIAQGHAAFEIRHYIRSKGLVGQTGREQVSIGFRISPFLLQGDEERFGRMLLQELDVSRKHIRLPINFLKLDAMIDTQFSVFTGLQTNVETTYPSLQLFGYGDVLCLQGFAAQQGSAIMSSR